MMNNQLMVVRKYMCMYVCTFSLVTRIALVIHSWYLEEEISFFCFHSHSH